MAHTHMRGQQKRALDSSKTLGVTSRGDRIRTCDLVLPKHPRYQAAPRPVGCTIASGSAHLQARAAEEGVQVVLGHGWFLAALLEQEAGHGRLH